jgi:hypothetical protein
MLLRLLSARFYFDDHNLLEVIGPPVGQAAPAHQSKIIAHTQGPPNLIRIHFCMQSHLLLLCGVHSYEAFSYEAFSYESSITSCSVLRGNHITAGALQCVMVFKIRRGSRLDLHLESSTNHAELR